MAWKQKNQQSYPQPTNQRWLIAFSKWLTLVSKNLNSSRVIMLCRIKANSDFIISKSSFTITISPFISTISFFTSTISSFISEVSFLNSSRTVDKASPKTRSYQLLLLVSAGDNKAVGILLGAAGFAATGNFAPHRLGAFGATPLPAFAAAVGMIHRIHRRTANRRPDAEPAWAASLAKGDKSPPNQGRSLANNVLGKQLIRVWQNIHTNVCVTIYLKIKPKMIIDPCLPNTPRFIKFFGAQWWVSYISNQTLKLFV